MFHDLYDIYILIIYYSKYTESKIDKNRQKLLYSTQNIQDPKTKLFLYYLFRNCTLLKIAKVNIKINVI